MSENGFPGTQLQVSHSSCLYKVQSHVKVLALAEYTCSAKHTGYHISCDGSSDQQRRVSVQLTLGVCSISAEKVVNFNSADCVPVAYNAWIPAGQIVSWTIC